MPGVVDLFDHRDLPGHNLWGPIFEDEPFLAAEEIFSTGNFAKVAPVIRIDDRQLAPGPFYACARKLYWDFAHAVKLAA